MITNGNIKNRITKYLNKLNKEESIKLVISLRLLEDNIKLNDDDKNRINNMCRSIGIKTI